MVTTGPIALSTGGRLIWLWLAASVISVCRMLPTPRPPWLRAHARVKVLETLPLLWNGIELTQGANSFTHAAIEQEVHVAGTHARGGACGFSSPRRPRGPGSARVAGAAHVLAASIDCAKSGSGGPARLKPQHWHRGPHGPLQRKTRLLLPSAPRVRYAARPAQAQRS